MGTPALLYRFPVAEGVADAVSDGVVAVIGAVVADGGVVLR